MSEREFISSVSFHYENNLRGCKCVFEELKYIQNGKRKKLFVQCPLCKNDFHISGCLLKEVHHYEEEPKN